MKKMEIYRGKNGRTREIPDDFLPDRIVSMSVEYIEDETLPYRIVSARYDNGVTVDQIYYGDEEVGFEDEEVAFATGAGPRDFEGNESDREIVSGLTVAKFCALGRDVVESVIAEEMMA